MPLNGEGAVLVCGVLYWGSIGVFHFIVGIVIQCKLRTGQQDIVVSLFDFVEDIGVVCPDAAFGFQFLPLNVTPRFSAVLAVANKGRCVMYGRFIILRRFNR